MRSAGGFEGNAQTLRIISRLEKKVRMRRPDGREDRAGLNLTYRLMAAVLKYDREIPLTRGENQGLVKGYYESEAELVHNIKRNTTGRVTADFKTIECWIMDLADDIAYSTYDLEDSMKAGFLTPASILASKGPLVSEVAAKVTSQLERACAPEDVMLVLSELFDEIGPDTKEPFSILAFAKAFQASQDLAQSGYLRTKLSSQLVHDAINAVKVEINPDFPMLSKAYLTDEAEFRIEVLKQYTYESMIYSSRVKLPEFRGYEVVKSIFEALASKKGAVLMPDDVREHHANCSSEKSAVAGDLRFRGGHDGSLCDRVLRSAAFHGGSEHIQARIGKPIAVRHRCMHESRFPMGGCRPRRRPAWRPTEFLNPRESTRFCGRRLGLSGRPMQRKSGEPNEVRDCCFRAGRRRQNGVDRRNAGSLSDAPHFDAAVAFGRRRG